MKPKSLIQKLVICLIAGLVCGETFLRVGDRFLSFLLPVSAVIGISIAVAASSLVYALIWHRRDLKDEIDNVKATAFWVGAIRYGIAFDLAMFGFQKIFHLQFTTPMGMLDEPFSSFSGQWLTWSYFGHSYGFACTIGISQIAGSMLLLFNRTRLFGAVFLMPVMLNIIFIDFFYGLDLGVLIHALILLAGLVYLLALDFNRLVDFFLRHEPAAAAPHVANGFLKATGRLSILFIPLLLIAVYPPPDKHPDVRGKYSVTDMQINGKTTMATTCTDSLLTLVYLDIGNECVFEFNGQKRRAYGTYDLNEGNGSIQMQWHYPQTMRDRGFAGTLRKLNDQEIELTGKFQNDLIQVRLKK